MSDARVAIFTLTKDRLEYTKRTIESLEAHTHIPYDHYIVDNGSTDGTVEYLKTGPGRVRKVIFNQENKGIGVAANQALDEMGSDYDYIIKLDNDCEIVSDDWLGPIIEVIKHMKDTIVLSPYVDGLGGVSAGGFPRHDYLTVNGYRIGVTKHIGGISVIAPAWVYQRYRFPLKAPLHGGLDVRFSSYVQTRLGLRLGYAEDIVVRHMDSTHGQHEKYPDYFALRSQERRTVYGEPLLLSRALRPIRKMLYIRSAHKAGITDETVVSWLTRKLKGPAE